MNTKTYRFSSAHFYHQPLWNEAQNKQTFGLCFDPYGHGHDYRLQIFFKEGIEAGVDQWAQKLVKKMDHRHLNHEIPFFKTNVPTTENIVLYFVQQFRDQNLFQKIKKIRLYERDDLWVEKENED